MSGARTCSSGIRRTAGPASSSWNRAARCCGHRTHVPPGQLGRLLAKVRGYFNQNRREIRAKAQVSRTEQRDAVQPVALQDSAPLSGALVTYIATATITAYDADNGGFALEAGYSGPKFPNFDAIAFLLSLGDGTGGGAATIVQESLDALLTRGLWDPEGGGLRRYAAERDWSRVHGEKLLLDNARLLGLLCRAGHQLQSDGLLAHARRVLDWCHRELGPDAPRFRASLRPPHEDVPAGWAVPAADDRVFTGPHAAMAAALFACGWALDDADAVLQATAILDLIWEEGREESGRLRHQIADPVPGTLSDHAEVAAAFLDAFEATGQRRFLERGEIVFEAATKHFRRPGAAFFDAVDDRDAAGRCRYRQRQAASNAGIALVALRLHALTRTDWYRDTGMEALAEFAGSAHKQGLFACRYAMAVLRYREPAPVAIIVGAASAPPAQALHAAALRLPIADLAVQWLDPLKDMETLTRFTVPQSRDARAYLCRGTEVLGPWRPSRGDGRGGTRSGRVDGGPRRGAPAAVAGPAWSRYRARAARP